MPPRRLPKTTAQKHELEAFAEKYDTYADIYGDPVERVFQIMADAEDEQVVLSAAGLLMGHRYPKVKPQDTGDGKNAPSLNFTVVMGEEKKQIDVTPVKTPLPTAGITIEVPGE